MRAPAAPPSACTCSSAEVAAPECGGVLGVAHEHEDIRTHVVPGRRRRSRWSHDGRIIAANGVVPLLWLQLHRERLRREWGSVPTAPQACGDPAAARHRRLPRADLIDGEPAVTMDARIYQPAKPATQSGRFKTRFWIVEHEPSSSRRSRIA